MQCTGIFAAEDEIVNHVIFEAKKFNQFELEGTINRLGITTIIIEK